MRLMLSTRHMLEVPAMALISQTILFAVDVLLKRLRRNDHVVATHPLLELHLGEILSIHNARQSLGTKRALGF